MCFSWHVIIIIFVSLLPFLPPSFTPLSESTEGISLQLGNSKDFILSLDIKFVSNGSVSVILETTEKGPPFTIHYVTNMQLISFKEREITYGIGPRTAWSTLTRDLLTDLRKGVGLSNTKAVKATKVCLKQTFGIDSTTFSESSVNIKYT